MSDPAFTRMEKHEKFTLAETQSGNYCIPIAILKNWFGDDLQDLVDAHKFYTIGIMCSEKTYQSRIHDIEWNFSYAQQKSFIEKSKKAQWYASKQFIEESIGLLHHYMMRLYSSIYAIRNEDNNIENFINNLDKKTKEFESKDFPNKVKTLNSYHSSSIAFENNIISLNSARNCFVHRLGIVSAKDIKDGGNNFIIKWRAIRIDKKSNPPDVFVNLEKEYALGTTIVFDHQECMDTMYTLMCYFEVLFNTCMTNLGLDKDEAFYEFKRG